MKKSDITSSIGIVLGFVAIIVGMLFGGSTSGFIDKGSIFITIVGSLAAVMLNTPMEDIKRLWRVCLESFKRLNIDKLEIVRQFSLLSRRARKEGLLSLEDEINKLEDEFLKKGLKMVVDGVEPENIRDILELEIESMEERHKAGTNMLRVWAAYAPGFGMIGTLIGLIQMLKTLDDSSKIASGMAVALVTTFYGSVMANLLFNPMAGKLEIRSAEEARIREMYIEGIIAIQSGLNPRIVEEKLATYLSPKEKIKFYDVDSKGEGVK